jgi:hypothetical protein
MNNFGFAEFLLLKMRGNEMKDLRKYKTSILVSNKNG